MNITISSRRKMGFLELFCEHGGHKAKLRYLGMTEYKLRGCRTLAEVQELGTQFYRANIKYYHPDTCTQSRPKGWRPAGKLTYQRLVESYKWLMKLTDEDIDKTNRKYETVEDFDVIPWGFGFRERRMRINGREACLGNGYQEVDDFCMRE